MKHPTLLTKKNYTTEKAIYKIATTLRIDRKNISYAGTKDKKAEFILRHTIGSFGLNNSFLSVSGTINSWNYIAYGNPARHIRKI